MHHMNLTFRRNSSIEGKRIQMTKWLILMFLLIGPVCHAQSATINWTNVHQVIDGFGAADTNEAGTPSVTLLTSAQAAFFFGTGAGDIGLSILRVQPPNGVAFAAGNCTTVSTSCIGLYASDIQYAVSYGARIYATPFSPPAAYTTNGSVNCTAGAGSGSLATGSYAAYATWLANFVISLQTYENANVAALTLTNEPEYCESYPSIVLSASQIDNFIKNNLGPTFSAHGLSTMITMPEVGRYGDLNGYGYLCAEDAACANYVGAVSYHDYDASVSGTDTVNADPYPSGWPSGKRYWDSEVSCQSGGGGPSFCNATFDPSMKNALGWAAILDQRFAVDNVSEWGYWWFIVPASINSGEGLMTDTGTIAERDYVVGQYSRFIRPGYNRIDATHVPQEGISVSSYQNTSSGNLVIVATNYTGSPISQTFNLTNAPTFSGVTPYITSATQDIQAQAAQPVLSNSFTYTLPADSVTTFVGTSSGSTTPVPPTNLRAAVN
jgi:glucuronoarabinoxylan endo-1,4-beta-xylanase